MHKLLQVLSTLRDAGNTLLVVRRMALGKVSKSNARGLALRSEDLLRACHEVVLALEARKKQLEEQG